MITKAIERAYACMHERNWDSIYWAVDLHGVCFASTYAQGGYAWINDQVLPALQAIVARPENKIILWSSCHTAEYQPIIEFFESQGIPILGFNENPEAQNTTSGNFDTKFYFSVLLDDKAGFDPDSDWADILIYFAQKKMKEEHFTGFQPINTFSQVFDGYNSIIGHVAYTQYVHSDDKTRFMFDYDLKICNMATNTVLHTSKSDLFENPNDLIDEILETMSHYEQPL